MKSTSPTQKLFALLILFSALSCQTAIDFGRTDGNGFVVTQVRNVTETFDKIEVNTGLDLIVTQSNTASVEVETDENIQALITTKVANGVLIVTSEESFNTSAGPKVSVSLPFVSGLKSGSGATIKSGNVLISNSLIVDASSGSSIELDVEADYISLESSSGSKIKVSGKALKAETASSSGSTISAGKLMANDVFSQASAGSRTKIFPIVSLKAKASSGSKIQYSNVPKKIEKEESSGGSISDY
jgi:hypothetical protein